MTTVATWPTVYVEVNFSGGTWTNITHYVRSMNAKRGRSYELDSSSPGTMTIAVDNHDGRFDPANASSPYYPNVLLFTKIRLRMVSGAYTLNAWQGYISSWPTEYIDSGNWQVASITAVGIMGMLAQKQMLTVGEEALKSPSMTMDYWWPLSTTTANTDTQTPEMVNGVMNGSISTFGGNRAVSLGSTPFPNPPLGLMGLGGASFTPDNPGWGLNSGMSVIRLMKPYSGGLLTLPNTPWTLGMIVQTNTIPPILANYVNCYFLEFTDSGGGNGTGIQDFSRWGISDYGELCVVMKDDHGALALQDINFNDANGNRILLADGKPHFVAIELSGSPLSFKISIDGSAAYTLGSGNGYGWVFTEFVTMNIGGLWPTNGTGSGPYKGVISNVVFYYGGQVSSGNWVGTNKLPTVCTQGYYGQLPGDRINSLMTLCGYSGLSNYLGAGNAQLSEAVTTGSTLDSVIKDTANWDGGYVYETGTGTITFVPGNYRMNKTPTIIVGDGASSLAPIESMVLSMDTSHIVTQAQVGSSKGRTETVDNTTAEARYGTWTLQISNMAVVSDTSCLALAQQIVRIEANPQVRVSSVVIDCGSNQSAMDLVMGLHGVFDLNVPITVKHKPVGGNVVTLNVWIESIEYEIAGSDSFKVKLELSPVDANKYLYADGAAVLDSATWVLAP